MYVFGLSWHQVRNIVGEEKFGSMFQGVKDPLTVMKVELDPSLREQVGWIDESGDYHAPWDDQQEESEFGDFSDSGLEQQSAESEEDSDLIC